jgi:Sec-independent protein translocase protein TatA
MLVLMPVLGDILGVGGCELVLIFAVVLILYGDKHLLGIARGLGKGFFQFRKNFDEVSHDAGESLGGIYGKPAAEALTPDNQTGEFYDPAVFHREERPNRMRVRRWLRWWRSIWHSVLKRRRASQ